LAKGGKKVQRLLLWFMFLLAIMLVGCSLKFGETQPEDKEVLAVQVDEGSEDGKEDEKNEEDEEEKKDVKKIDQKVADDEYLKANVKEIVKIDDERWDEERYEVYIDLENKHDETIVVTSKEASADDIMIDKMVYFSETVSSGKKAYGKMIVENHDGPLPEMKKNLEFILHIYTPDQFDLEEDYEVKIKF